MRASPTELRCPSSPTTILRSLLGVGGMSVDSVPPVPPILPMADITLSVVVDLDFSCQVRRLEVSPPVPLLACLIEESEMAEAVEPSPSHSIESIFPVPSPFEPSSVVHYHRAS